MQKPLPVSTYSLSLRQAQDLLGSVGMSSALILRVFDTFARRRERSCSWSRVLGEAPESRIDALELFSGLALTCRATLKEKMSILFYLFDAGETGVLTEDDLGAMVSSCASVLRHLKLSLPISNDEAAFVAGAAFGHQQSRGTGSTTADCGNYERECDVDEIDLPSFLTWAQRAELPSRALEILALPHRLSRMVDLVSSRASSILRERYIPGTPPVCSSSNAESMARRKVSIEFAPNQSLPERRIQAQRSDRASTLPMLRGEGGNLISRPFALTPYLGRIGPHSANVLFEIGTSSHPTAEVSTWRADISVEERCESRFYLVDSQQINLRVGAPAILQLSCLRAATDHRLTIDLRLAPKKRKGGGVQRKLSGGQHIRAKCGTLRFTTLPEDSLVAISNPGSNTVGGSFPNKKEPSRMQRRCIALAKAWQQEACPFDEAQYLQPYPTDRSPGNTASVSVLINCGQRTCLEAVERTPGLDGRNATVETTVTDPQVLVQSWPPRAPALNHGLSVSRSTNNVGDGGAFRSGGHLAPFCGEAVPRGEVPLGENAEPWARDGEGKRGGTDLVVHLRPDWRAVEVVRRCFQVLEQCRFESPTTREDGRRMVSTEVNKAVISLVTWCFRARRGTLRDGARRSCAHIVLGDLQHPWLGLEEVRVGPYSLDALQQIHHNSHTLSCGYLAPTESRPSTITSHLLDDCCIFRQ